MTSEEERASEEEKVEVEERAEIKQLRDSIARILGFDIDRDLVRTSQLGIEGSFEAGRPLFAAIQEYLGKLPELPWSLLNERQAAPLSSDVMNLAATLDDINRFSLAEADAFTRRDELLKNTQAHFDTLREAAAPLVGYLAWQSLDLGRMQRESSLILAEIRTSSGLGHVPSEKAQTQPGSVEASVSSDLVLHLIMGRPKLRPAAERMRSLLDLSNGMSNDVIAIGLGLVLIAVTACITSLPRLGNEIAWSRVYLGGGWIVAGSVILVFVINSQRRVSDVCGAYLESLIEGSNARRYDE